MNPKVDPADPRLLKRWIRATLFGWLLGFLLVIAMVIIGGMIGMGEFQFPVGVGMGAGVGYMQGRIVRQWLGGIGYWVTASVVGLGVPFVLSDLAVFVWDGFAYSLPLCVSVGGLLAGLLQRRLLRTRFHRANWWILASVAGWVAAVAPILALDSMNAPRGPWSVLVFPGVMFLGAFVCSYVTGKVLVWLIARGPISGPPVG